MDIKEAYLPKFVVARIVDVKIDPLSLGNECKSITVDTGAFFLRRLITVPCQGSLISSDILGKDIIFSRDGRILSKKDLEISSEDSIFYFSDIEKAIFGLKPGMLLDEVISKMKELKRP